MNIKSEIRKFIKEYILTVENKHGKEQADVLRKFWKDVE